MPRYIDADELKRKVLGLGEDVICDDCVCEFINLIDEAHTADVVPAKRGKWEKNEGRHGWHCSACGEDDLYAFSWNCDKGENELQDHYCPKCGARMEGDQDA